MTLQWYTRHWHLLNVKSILKWTLKYWTDTAVTGDCSQTPVKWSPHDANRKLEIQPWCYFGLNAHLQTTSDLLYCRIFCTRGRLGQDFSLIFTIARNSQYILKKGWKFWKICHNSAIKKKICTIHWKFFGKFMELYEKSMKNNGLNKEFPRKNLLK
jgi:hypothetical protein